MGRLEVPALGFEVERWYGNGLYECCPHKNMVVYIEGTLSFHERQAAGRPISVLVYNYECGKIRTQHFVNDFFEAKMVIQAELELITSGGNYADTRNGQRD
jgi:hypothetical protein